MREIFQANAYLRIIFPLVGEAAVKKGIDSQDKGIVEYLTQADALVVFIGKG